MNDFEKKIKDDITVETISKAIINETSKWDFKQADFISLINDLLDLSLIKSPNNKSKVKTKEKPERIKLEY